MTDTHSLIGDDAMAFSFLSRAANAIVAASDLSKQMVALKDDLRHISEARDTLEEIKRNQEGRISDLEADCDGKSQNIAALSAQLSYAKETIDDRQRSINILDSTVADLRADLNQMTHRAQDAEAKSALLSEALDATLAKLNAVRHAMGQPDLEPDPRQQVEDATKPSELTAIEESSESADRSHESTAPIESLAVNYDLCYHPEDIGTEEDRELASGYADRDYRERMGLID